MLRPLLLLATTLTAAVACASARAPSGDPGWVYVQGAVHYPGRFPIVTGKKPFTLTKLMAVCGDFQQLADTSNLRILRGGPPVRETFDVAFGDILEGRRPDFELHADDVVIVPERK